MSIIGNSKTKKSQLKIAELEAEIISLTKKYATLENRLNVNNESLSNIEIFNYIFRILSAGYIEYRSNSEQLILSDSLMELFENQFPSKEILIENFINIIHTEDKAFVQELFLNPRGSKKKLSGQFRISAKSKDNKETKYFAIATELSKFDSDDNLVVYVIREISKEVKQLKEIQRSKEKSQESDNIKTAFLTNISHNIRTPMNSILGFAELLSISDPGPERRKEYIRLIKKQSKNLLQLIDDVSEIARYESGTMTITKTLCKPELLINEIYRDCENLKSTLNKEHINFTLNYPSDESIEIYTDAGRIHQIFFNLINYSLKNNSQGTIDIGYKLLSENKIDFFIRTLNDTITKEEQKNIYSLNNLFEISNINRYDEEIGLGLTIAKGIIKLLGGKIWIDSDVEASTTINFNIPFEPKAVSHNEHIENELENKVPYKWNNKVILIVEDEEVNGLFLEAVFHDTGARTLYVKNGMQAVELCKTISKIDLILMDIRMPVMNGLKATQEIRKFNQNVPIIAQTALSLEEDRQQCLLAGCNDSITKPIDVEELLFLLNKYLSA